MRSNEQIVRAAYAAAEAPLDVEGFIELFSEDGYLYNVSAGETYHGREVGDLVKGGRRIVSRYASRASPSLSVSPG
jgi:hypothetical protein